MENSITLLGASQTFVGVLSTLTILCIGRNANNFMYEVLKDIKSQIIAYTKRLKPKITLDSVKKSSDYGLIFLYCKNENNKKNKELYDICTNAVSKVDEEKFELQAKLTNWDNNVIIFTNSIEDKKEQQKGPMFAFAFSIIVFVFDELLRCTYVHGKAVILALLSLFTLYVVIYWSVKWVVFMLKDDSILTENSESAIHNCVQKILKKITSLKNRYQFMIHLVMTFLLLFVYSLYYTSFQQCLKLIYYSLICFFPFIVFGLIHMFGQEKHSDEKVTMHYVYHFLYMFFLSVFIVLFSKIFIPDIFDIIPLQDKEYIFYLKSLIIGFILCVGLVCPFLCTLVKYNMVYLRACVKFLDIKIQTKLKARNLQKRFEDVAAKIPRN